MFFIFLFIKRNVVRIDGLLKGIRSLLEK